MLLYRAVPQIAGCDAGSTEKEKEGFRFVVASSVGLLAIVVVSVDC